MNILRIEAVLRRTGLSRTTIWRMEQAREFPSRVRLSPNSVGWREDEIEAWLQERPRAALPAEMGTTQ